MAQSQYLDTGEYANYGLPGSTSAAQVAVASTLVNAYLMRPEGLIYEVDGHGQPAWMAALDATLELTLAAPASPGLNVAVTVTEPYKTKLLQPGDVLVLDSASNSPDVSEAAVVQSVNGSTIVFNSLTFAHSGGGTLEAGLVVVEEKVLPAGRPKSRVAHFPIARLVSGLGRYGFGRRSQGSSGYPLEAFNLLATLQQFGGPPIWEQMNVDNVGISPGGDFWIPAGILLAYYTRVRLAFVCGYPADAIPVQVKQAVANIIINGNASVAMPGNIKSAKAGDTQIVKFASSLIDDDTKSMLDPLRVRLYA